MKRTCGIAVLLIVAFGGAGCSVKRLAVNKLGDALASSGTTFASDNDPELIRDAVPFSLKLMESLLAESPNHRGLLTASARGFTQYAYAFVQQDADRLNPTDLARSREQLARAKALYLRARDYGLRGLATRRGDFMQALDDDPQAAVAPLQRRDLDLIFWTAASWVAAIAADKTDALLVSDLPKIDALLARALELDETFDQGALPALMIAYEPVRQGVEGDPFERAERQFQRAVALSSGRLAGPYVALAEAVCIPTEQRERFLQLLDQALAIDPDAAPESRLVNLIVQQRARWLRERVDDYFLPPLEED